jgi:hypothetical protein
MCNQIVTDPVIRTFSVDDDYIEEDIIGPVLPFE